MCETSNAQEQANKEFSDRNVSVLEARIFGNTYPVPLENGEQVVVDADNMHSLYMRNPNLLRSPLGILRGTETIENVNKARAEQDSVTGMVISLFGYEGFCKLHAQGIKSFSKLVPINEQGQIPYIQIYFKDEDGDIDLEEGDENEFVPKDEYAAILEKGRIVDNSFIFDFKTTSKR